MGKPKLMPYATGGFSPFPEHAKMQISALEFELFRELAVRLEKAADPFRPKEETVPEEEKDPDEGIRKSKRRKKQTVVMSIGIVCAQHTIYSCSLLVPFVKYVSCSL